MRQSSVERKTKETEISLQLTLDGSGQSSIATPLPFLNHMLESFSRHGLFDLTIRASGDVDVDAHHLVEDIGLVLGDAFTQALGDKRGVRRFGQGKVPMDETLAEAVVDLSGRPYFVWHVGGITGKRVGTFDAELGHEFFQALAQRAQANLHMKIHYGENAHHILEALWKASARAFKMACEFDSRVTGVPSTKGTLVE